jgi:hypothetical protein
MQVGGPSDLFCCMPLEAWSDPESLPFLLLQIAKSSRQSDVQAIRFQNTETPEAVGFTSARRQPDLAPPEGLFKRRGNLII